MSKNFLLIVEGAKTEKSILSSILEKYDVEILNCGQIDLKTNIADFFINIYDTPKRDRIFLVQGPKNRIHDWLKHLKTNEEDYELFFNEIEGSFAGVFIIYDVDHTSKDELDEMFKKYNDETAKGLLLLSSPCIEVLADIERVEPLECGHLREYKAQLNTKFNLSGFNSAEKYIIKNFNELALFYIDKNAKESGSNNVMDHPKFVVSKINDLNDRTKTSDGAEFVYYRYFTTVIYVCIAYINGLTKEIENVELIKKFFSDNNNRDIITS